MKATCVVITQGGFDKGFVCFGFDFVLWIIIKYLCPIGKFINAELRKFNLNFFFGLESSNRNVVHMLFYGKVVEMESVFSNTESSIFGTAVSLRFS